MMQGGVNHGTLPPHNTHNKSQGGGLFRPPSKNYKIFFALLIRLEGINTQSLCLLIVTQI